MDVRMNVNIDANAAMLISDAMDAPSTARHKRICT